MATEEKKQNIISWEDNVMRVRDEATLVLSHSKDDLFLVLDPFFKTTIQIFKQMNIITQENDRLIKILEKNKIDYAPEPPKPLTKDQLPAKTIEEAGATPEKKGILPKKD